MTSATGRLIELFNKQLEGPLSPEEKQELSQYALQEELQPLLRQLIGNAWHSTGEEADLSAEKAAAIQTYILSGDETTEPAPRLRSVQPRWWWAAAAVFFMAIGGSIVWYVQHQHVVTGGHQTFTTDIGPGSNGAILTLSDGRQVVLDSLGNNIVSDKHGVQAMVKDGKLQYNAAPSKKSELIYHTVTTPRGKQFKLQLPDGSHVWLNTASSITYPTTFSGSERQVSVTGEVYIEVQNQSANHPFVVNSRQQKVTVLSTSFNINSYEDDFNIKTTLRDGKIRVETLTNSESRILQPGQQSLVAAGKPIQVKEANLDEVLAWQMGYFNFTNASFAEIMHQLSRWYDIEVKYEHQIPQIEFEGKLNQSVNLSRVLEFFKESGIRFRLENHTLIIS